MKKNYVVAALGGLALLSTLALASPSWVHMRVESAGGRRNYVSVHNHGVRLARQLSSAPCIRGRTWGADRQGIWVSRGCRGDFRVNTW